MPKPPQQQFYLDLTSALDHLRDEHAPISPSALFALSNASPRVVETFAHAWSTIPPERRRRVTQSMVELAEETIQANFHPILRYLLDDEDPEVRVQAIDGLWEDEDQALIRPLVGLLRSDPAARVRASAALALGSFAHLAELQELPPGPTRLVREALLAVIRNSEESTDVRRRAVEAVAFFSDEEVRGIISAAYENDDPQFRASAIFAMGRSADPYWRNTILRELDSNDGQLRFEAARASGELELKKAVPRLIRLLHDPDLQVVSASIQALGQIGGAEAKEALERIVEDEDEVNQEAAREALEELDFTSGTDLLLLDMDLSDRELLENELANLDELEDDDATE